MFCCLVSSGAGEVAVLESVARACSPRVACAGGRVLCDVAGCERTVGPPEVIVREISTLASARGLTVRTAIAPTVTAAWLLAHARPGATVVAPGREAAALADLPLHWLETLVDLDGKAARASRAVRRSSRSARRSSRSVYAEPLATLARWRMGTLGDLAALDRRDVHARMGPFGVRLHQAAYGEDARPFVPEEGVSQWVERMELEWPIDGLEPLAFVLARLFERLSTRLERADRGAIEIRTRLRLVTRETHERVLHLPAPIGEARVLRTLVLLDLESHSPSAAIEVVELRIDVAPGRIVLGALFDVSLPSPEDLTTLTTRLGALVGTSRVGSPALLDTHDEKEAGMTVFRLPGHAPGKEPRADDRGQGKDRPWPVMVRRFRLAVAARVVAVRGAPVRVVPSIRGLAGGEVVARAGPWRTSGRWWTRGRTSWDQDEWDVEVADHVVYRLTRDLRTGLWEIEGVLD